MCVFYTLIQNQSSVDTLILVDLTRPVIYLRQVYVFAQRIITRIGTSKDADTASLPCYRFINIMRITSVLRRVVIL